MKLHTNLASERRIFTGSGSGFIAVDGQRYATSMMVAPSGVETWNVSELAALDSESLQVAERLRPDVILLGTGATFQYPDLTWLRDQKLRLAALGIGLEIMDTAAVCRTYNILREEGRMPAALVIVRAEADQAASI
jgi:uncharacterized protein